MQTISSISDRVLLVILDGYGIGEEQNKNAVRDASSPNLDRLFANYPFTLLEAGGESVGLPSGIVGNSEVGHMNLGAGRPIRQDLVRINESIAGGTFANLDKMREMVEEGKKGSGRVHIMGLLSDGGVHSHIDHILESIDTLAEAGLKVYFHAFMDGRDTPKDWGAKYVGRLQKNKNVTLASMQGRSIGMDRDRRWDKIKDCYHTITGRGQIEEISPLDYLKREYAKGRYDEFIKPVLFHRDYAMGGEDVVFFANFRPDRAVQITLAMCDPNFAEFERSWTPKYYLCMTPYIPEQVELPILFDKEKVSGGLSEYLSSLGISQYKIAETEKYAHITFFFNGGEKNSFPKEQHVLINSPRDVDTYDQKPEMSAYEVTDNLLEALENEDYKFYLVNYANPDMVGHTGNYEAAVKAIEAVDDCVGKLMEKCSEQNIAMILTSDHGNSDQMVYQDGSPHTSHTNSPVPFAIYHHKLYQCGLKPTASNLSLKDISPTIVNMMGLGPPPSFTGTSIF